MKIHKLRTKKFYNIGPWTLKLVLVEPLTLQGPGSHIKGVLLNSGGVWQVGHFICWLSFGRQTGRTWTPDSVKLKTILRVKMEIGCKSAIEMTVRLLATRNQCYKLCFTSSSMLSTEKASLADIFYCLQY